MNIYEVFVKHGDVLPDVNHCVVIKSTDLTFDKEQELATLGFRQVWDSARSPMAGHRYAFVHYNAVPVECPI